MIKNGIILWLVLFTPNIFLFIERYNLTLQKHSRIIFFANVGKQIS